MNKATSRNYINPFMVEAVTIVQAQYKSTRLVVEEQFDGSRGFGRLDYVVFCDDLAVVVTEAKKIEFQKGIAQNIVQLHTAIEVPQCLYSFYCSLVASLNLISCLYYYSEKE